MSTLGEILEHSIYGGVRLVIGLDHPWHLEWVAKTVYLLQTMKSSSIVLAFPL